MVPLGRKKPTMSQKLLWVVGGVMLIALAVSAYIVFIPARNPLSPEPIVSSLSDETEQEEITPVVNVAFGTVTEVDMQHVVISVAKNDTDTPYTFTFTPQTEFYSFGYANDDDLVGTQATIDISQIKRGDEIAVYSETVPSSAASQVATKLVHVLQ